MDRIRYIKNAINENKTIVMTFKEFIDITGDNIYNTSAHNIVKYLVDLYNIEEYKVVARRFNVAGKNILYWAPCDFSIMILIADNIKISNKNEFIIDTKSIKDEEHNSIKYSFMGKDIKRSIVNFINGKDKYIVSESVMPKDKESRDNYFHKLDILLDAAANFNINYINNNHPIMDNVFYMVYCKPDHNNDIGIVIKSARNIDLSPRKK